MLRPIELTKLHLKEPVVLSIGVFDGVHLGHQSLLGQVVARARELRASAVALTFEPHPQEVLSPGVPWPYLTDLCERAALIGQLGVDVCAYLPFDLALARTGAGEFMDLVLRHLPVAQLWVGPDFALGSGRRGTISRLREVGSRRGFTVHSVPPFELDGEVVSSTSIRRLLAEGDVGGAARLLGRCYSLTGPVVEGDKRGRTLGFPTANLAFDQRRALPADGVYAVFASLPPDFSASSSSDGASPAARTWPAVVSLGLRPTFGGGQRTIEAFLLDFTDSLYGRRLTLQFVQRLRPERKFPSPAALIEQMQLDVASAREILAREACPPQPTPVC